LILAWLPRAIKNRDAQIDHIAKESPKAAIDQGDRIEEQINRLVDYPEMGKPGRKKGTREMVISKTPFIVVYRYKPRIKRIEIMRLLHGSQQYP
jgi:toxin ParE1/3/4